MCLDRTLAGFRLLCNNKYDFSSVLKRIYSQTFIAYNSKTNFKFCEAPWENYLKRYELAIQQKKIQFAEIVPSCTMTDISTGEHTCWRTHLCRTHLLEDTPAEEHTCWRIQHLCVDNLQEVASARGIRLETIYGIYTAVKLSHSGCSNILGAETTNGRCLPTFIT